MIGNHLEPFKFWCQKVLPNVYDDSLSYYEYLCKLNEYLNEVIGQINTLTDNMSDYEEDLTTQWGEYKTGLNTEWNDYKTQLTEQWTYYKNYIDHYFDNLDVQTEINNKLDQMALNGTLSALIEPFVGTDIQDTVNAWLTAHVNPVGSAVIVDNTLTIESAAADAKATGLLVANEYDSTSTYDIQSYVLHSGKIYRCITPITVAENWNGDHWQRVILGNEIKTNIYKAYGLYDSNLNNCINCGTYYLGSNCTNIPSDLTSVNNMTLFVFNGSAANGRYIHQFLFSASTEKTYHRLIERDGTVIRNWEIFTDNKSLAEELTSSLNLIPFKLVRKWYKSSSGTETVLTKNTEYIEYSKYNNPSSLDSTTCAIIAKSDTPIYTVKSNASANSKIDTEICLMITAPENCIYNIYLMEESANSWSPTNRRIAKDVYLTKGTHCIILNDCLVANNLTANLELKTIAINALFLNSATANLSFSVCKTSFMGAYNYNVPENNTPYGIVFWGDSLTRGSGGDGTTYCQVCANLLGMNFVNCGVGGETSNTIASRQGGNNMIIPKGNVNGTYTLSQLVDGYGKRISPLRQYMFQDTVNPVIINGQECNMSISQVDASDPNATYTISGYTGTLMFDTPALFSGSKIYGDVTVIFVGTNDYSEGIENRISVIKSMISKINNKYVIMGLSIGESTDMYTDDARMQKEFGNHFFPTRTMLVQFGLALQEITPTEQDTADIALGKVPTSLRSDSVHLNANGYTALGKMLASKIVGLGYGTYKS